MTARPRVTLKLATSLDGRIATAVGESKWITGELARAAAHELRGHSAAILVGVETVLADDPELTVRTPGYKGRQPLRVVLDSRQRLPLTSKLAQTAREIPTLVVSVEPPRPELEALGVRVVRVKARDGRPDVRDALRHLRELDIDSLLVEGGGQVAASFLRANVVERLEWFRAPILLGAEGRPAIGPLSLENLALAPRFQISSIDMLGRDQHERYDKVFS